MKARRIKAVAAIGALFLTALAGYLFLTSATFGMLLLEYVQKQTAPLGINLEASSVKVSASAPHLTIDKLLISKHKSFEITAKKVVLTVKSAQFGIPNNIQSVKVYDAIFLVHLPQTDKTKLSQKEFDDLKLPTLNIDFDNLPFGVKVDNLEVYNAFLILEREKHQLAYVGPFFVHINKTRKKNFAVNFAAEKTELSIPNQKTLRAKNVKLLATLKRHSVKIDSLSFTSKLGEALITANWQDLRIPKIALTLHATANLNKFSQTFAEYLPELQGNAEIEATANLNKSLKNSKFQGVVNVNKLRIKTADGVFKVDKAHIPFNWQNNIFQTNGARLCLSNSGCFVVKNAQIKTQNNWQTKINAYLQEVELARVLDATTITDSYVMLKIYGEANLNGTLKNPFWLKGKATLNAKSFLLLNHSFEAQRSKDDVIMQIPSAQIKTNISIDSKRVRLTNGTVKVNASVISIVRNDFNFDGTFYLEYKSKKLRITDAGAVAGINFGGIATALHTTISGPYDNPTIISTAKVKNFEIEGIKVGAITLHQHFYNGVLRFTDVETTDNKRLQANLKLDFNPQELTIESDFYSEGLRIEQVLAALGVKKKQDIKGEFFGAGEIRGKISALYGNLSGAIADLSVYGVKIPNLKLSAHLENGRNIVVENAEARFKQGVIKITGAVDINGKLSFEAFSRKLKLSHIEQLSKILPQVDANAQLVAKISGTTNHPLLEANIHLTNITYSNVPLEDCQATVNLDGKDLSVVAHLLGNQAVINLKTNTGNWQTTVEGNIKDLDIASLLKGAGTKLTSGAVSATFTLKGRLDKPNSFYGKLKLNSAAIQKDKLFLNIIASDTIKIKEGRIALNKIQLQGPDSLVGSITGYIEFENLAYELLISGSSNFSLLKRIIDTEDLQTEGNIVYKLTISGSSKAKTVIDGSAVLTKGMLVWNSVLPRIENIEATVVFSGNTAELERFKAISGGGSVNASGAVLFTDNWDIESTNISIALRKVRLKLEENINPIVDADLLLTGSKLPLKLKGDARIVSLRYVHNIPWETRLFENLSRIFSPHKRVRILRRNEQPVIAFDINIYGKNSIKIYNNLAQIDFTADLKLVGTNTAVGLLGSLSASKGVLKFQTRDFLIRSFVVRFTEADRIFAEFNVLAETDPIEYVCGPNEGTTRITVNIKGNEDSYQVEYSADAIDLIDKTQVWSVLVAGDCGMREATFESSMKNLVGGIITNPFEKSFGVDTRIVFEPVQTISGTTKVVPRFTIGKRLTPNMTIIYSSTFAEEEGDDRRIEIRYRKKNFSMSGEWSSGTVLKQGGLGIEIIYHFEF